MMEYCPTGKKGKHIVNPIIDWTEADVWLLHQEYSIAYCDRYDHGHKRLGCIGCPIAGTKGITRDFIAWPYYFTKYLIAFQMMLDKRREDGLKDENWGTGHDVMRWWLALSNFEYDTFLQALKVAMIKKAKPHLLHYTDKERKIL